MNPYDVIEFFEKELCAYTGADFAVCTDSCTNSLMLCCEYLKVKDVSIPRYTYRSVPMAILHGGGRIDQKHWNDDRWSGCYRLDPYPIVDSARRFRAGMFPGLYTAYTRSPCYVCVSFHHTKVLRGNTGGAILHNDPAADSWFRRARHDGRTDGLDVHDDPPNIIGHRCTMTPGEAAMLRARLAVLPQHNEDVAVPEGHYPDLSLTDWNKLYDRQRNR